MAKHWLKPKCEHKKATPQGGFEIRGSTNGSRTRLSALKGPRPNR